MKHLNEYRNAKLAAQIIQKIKSQTKNNWTIMEVCGGQTHTICQYGIQELLPASINLVHGPGCPVCVTPLEQIDKCIAIAKQPDVILCSFGDMLRVPGSQSDLLEARANGADVRIVYSPLECLKICTENPDKNIVFFAVGFETTAPANAMLAWQAAKQNISNLFMLVSHVTVPPVLETVLNNENNLVQAFLAPGHVCTIMGTTEYERLSADHKIPIVVTGFEPIDLLEGILMCVEQLENNVAELQNQYKRMVCRNGNDQALQMIQTVFEPSDRLWRGLGTIAMSGYKLSKEFSRFDAESKFMTEKITALESQLCISKEILLGQKKPKECSAFGKECTPLTPLGATMVSSEGTCAAYYKYQRIEID
ncbi:hydrogenase formation protein HypD [bacterium]|nr:hydrogenase formation protein HypD [bacterium]